MWYLLIWIKFDSNTNTNGNCNFFFFWFLHTTAHHFVLNFIWFLGKSGNCYATPIFWHFFSVNSDHKHPPPPPPFSFSNSLLLHNFQLRNANRTYFTFTFSRFTFHNPHVYVVPAHNMFSLRKGKANMYIVVWRVIFYIAPNAHTMYYIVVWQSSILINFIWFRFDFWHAHFVDFPYRTICISFWSFFFYITR